MTVVAVLALDGVVPFELTMAGQVFGTANFALSAPHYDVRVCAGRRTVTTSPDHGKPLILQTSWGLDALAEADTVIVPGRHGFLEPPPSPVAQALRDAAARGARLASVGVGAFTLAATGLLDGHRATTHWQYADELARRHPHVDVDKNVLFIDNGNLVTSAGVTSGLDLFLHLVRRDLGSALAAATARHNVMPMQRDGAQAQFVEHPRPAPRDTSLQPTLHWLENNLHRPLALDEIAEHSAMSVRSLNRHFRAQTGTTPLKWLLRARIHRAQQLLETTDMSVTHVAHMAGFGSHTTLRHHFANLTGISPHAYRTAFRTRPNPIPPRQDPTLPGMH